MFAVIEFSPEQGGGLSLVNKKWLTPRKKEVFWPPYKEQKQFNRSLQKSEEINTETWRLYNVKRIFYETDDYDDAISKLKKAEVTSDLQTDQEDEVVPKKRKIFKPAKLLESSDDEEDFRQIPPPPPIKRALFKDSSSEKQRSTVRSPVRQNSDVDGLASALLLTSPNYSNTVGQSTPLPEKSTFQIIILEHLLELQNQNKLILAKLTELGVSAQPKIDPEIPVKLPIKTLGHLDLLENFLQQQNRANLLVTYFTGFGGTSVISRTNRVLKQTFDDSVATLFNFYGRNKRAFNSLKLCSCVIEAVRSSCGCSILQVEGAIKVWLKHAPQRLKVKKRDNQDINETANGVVQ